MLAPRALASASPTQLNDRGRAQPVSPCFIFSTTALKNTGSMAQMNPCRSCGCARSHTHTHTHAHTHIHTHTHTHARSHAHLKPSLHLKPTLVRPSSTFSHGFDLSFLFVHVAKRYGRHQVVALSSSELVIVLVTTLVRGRENLSTHLDSTFRSKSCKLSVQGSGCVGFEPTNSISSRVIGIAFEQNVPRNGTHLQVGGCNMRAKASDLGHDAPPAPSRRQRLDEVVVQHTVLVARPQQADGSFGTAFIDHRQRHLPASHIPRQQCDAFQPQTDNSVHGIQLTWQKKTINFEPRSAHSGGGGGRF